MEWLALLHWRTVGSLVMQQVATVRQAAVEHGADIIVAQAREAGDYGGSVATLGLVPQVVDAVLRAIRGRVRA